MKKRRRAKIWFWRWQMGEGLSGMCVSVGRMNEFTRGFSDDLAEGL